MRPEDFINALQGSDILSIARHSSSGFKKGSSHMFMAMYNRLPRHVQLTKSRWPQLTSTKGGVTTVLERQSCPPRAGQRCGFPDGDAALGCCRALFNTILTDGYACIVYLWEYTGES
ncbi:hypothetical protein J6590_016844 [Homalodisca vitripennis]|nr:hypothetical protein J6590_016842 [Homalodisca vitripennis]KAG8278581.1 hypothetical protein J6590_016844 [Homalodisca vitripennis]